MLTVDILSLTGIVMFVLVWWMPRAPRRDTALSLAAAVGLAPAVYGVLDLRWQLWPAVLFGGLMICLRLGRRLRGDRPLERTPWKSSSLLVVLALPVVALPVLFPVHPLPQPAGTFSVGVRDFELRDDTRTGVLAAAAGEPRRLLVRVWYPAGDTRGSIRRAYFTDREAETTATGLGSLIDLPFFFQYVRHVATNSYVDAPLAPTAGDLPVIMFSHGYTSFAGQNTALMEHLASHGYLTFSIQHSYDASPTVFPDGSVLPMDPALLAARREGPLGPSDAERQALGGVTYDERLAGTRADLADISHPANRRLLRESAPTWLADRQFVLDALQDGRVPDHVAAVVASGRYDSTGQMGMSFGGSTTGGLCMVDERCAAAINMDGSDLHGTPLLNDIPVPFLMLSSDRRFAADAFELAGIPDDFVMNEFSYEYPGTAGLRDDLYRLELRDVRHLGVSDFTYFLRNPVRRALLGGIDGLAMLELQNDLVLAFFDKHLLGKAVRFPASVLERHGDHLSLKSTDALRSWWVERRAADPRS